MEELQWARIRVRIKEDRIPNMVDIWVENTCYAVALWWEIRPTLRKLQADDKGRTLAGAGEGEGEFQTREGKRVMEEEGGSRLETQTQVVDGMWRLTAGAGQPMDSHHGLGGSHLGLQDMERMQGGPLVLGLLERPCGLGGLSIQSSLVDHVGPKEWGDFRRPRIWKPKEGVGLVAEGPSVETSLHSNVAQICGPSSSRIPAPEDPLLREKDDMRRLSGAELIQNERSSTDLALAEEAMRYDKVSDCLVSGTPSLLSPFFGRTPVGEYCDFSGDDKERDEGENPIQMIMGSKSPTGENVDCWDLVEAEGELSWEKSDLAKFSNFLGFSTEGLEKDIMEFLVKIRKRRERVHSKSLLEKTKFERELRRLECSINYEGGKKQNGVIRSQRVDLFCLQETKIQSLSEGLVRSLGAGRWSNWVALDAVGSAGGMLVCWDKRSLEVMETEVGKFSASCRFRNVENGLTWSFTGVYGPFSKRERNRQGRLTGAMRFFAQTVDELELMDLPMQGGAFTWSGGRNNQSWARLDRFLVTQQWLEMFSGVAQCRLQRPTSDHFPILLMGGGLRRGPTPFRFENMWLKVDGFKGLLREWWQGIEQVEYWDGVESERCLSLAETEQKKEAKDAFHKWVLLEEVHWRQKIMINGEWLTEDQEVREGIVTAFQNLLSEEPGWRADIEGLHLNQLTSREAEDLEKPFTEEEVHGALMEMRGDKAPGPDGFTMAFWQECWPFVKEEMMDLFKEFFEYGSFSKCLNNTFLVLIPKKGGAEDLGDFRPISLLDQNAFVRGRQILDASLVANEVIDYWHKRKEKGLICKLDIEKAYDSLNWEFLMKASGRGGVEMNVSHLLFADDTIIFCKAEREQVSNLSWILAWFEAASGLRINLAKSALIPVGQVDELEEMALS
ncbi:Transposon TX1 uncharacterized 149 kDa protein [Vitis vinifera]|uniref:Transposon TX1 uncharacterized 149 kDa protein n=1 Tax=Vitis vinifera TaxID=29760 RepID=A0A438H1L3_VITVI|nr:Transposon TX1 uncharacterized 149 kDa protein [Vitis vinifera]